MAAPRPAKVAKVSPPIKLLVPVLDERLRISSSKVLPILSAVHAVPPDLAAVQSPGPPRRRDHPAFVTRQRHLRSPRRTHKLALLNLLNRGRQPASWNWCPAHLVGFSPVSYTSYFIEPTHPPLPIILLPTEPLL